MVSAGTVLLVFLKLGLTSFGGPVAHLGYFRDEFVVRRRWLDEKAYADLVALCQFLPGPASSQVGMAIGLSQSGIRGALAAWIGFTAPSAMAMILFGYGIAALGGSVGQAGWLHGLKLAAVAVVAHAIWGMAKALISDRARATVAVFAAAAVLAWPTSWGQITVLVIGGMIGWLMIQTEVDDRGTILLLPIDRWVSIVCLAVFVVALLGLPVLANVIESQSIILIDRFYRVGALVFGGGHVVLPLLQAQVVSPGWVGNDVFVAGYGAAQAVPGPLLTFSAYLGTVMRPEPHGWIGGVLCLVAVFLPSFLLVVGALPFWETLRTQRGVRSASAGVNAAVVGLLVAAFYDPVWTTSILSAGDVIVSLAAFGLLAFWMLPPWLVVGLSALAAAGLAAI